MSIKEFMGRLISGNKVAEPAKIPPEALQAPEQLSKFQQWQHFFQEMRSRSWNEDRVAGWLPQLADFLIDSDPVYCQEIMADPQGLRLVRLFLESNDLKISLLRVRFEVKHPLRFWQLRNALKLAAIADGHKEVSFRSIAQHYRQAMRQVPGRFSGEPSGENELEAILQAAAARDIPQLQQLLGQLSPVGRLRLIQAAEKSKTLEYAKLIAKVGRSQVENEAENVEQVYAIYVPRLAQTKTALRVSSPMDEALPRQALYKIFAETKTKNKQLLREALESLPLSGQLILVKTCEDDPKLPFANDIKTIGRQVLTDRRQAKR